MEATIEGETTRLNEIYKSIEITLLRFNYGVRGEVLLERQNTEEEREYFLCFAKRNGEWGLFIQTTTHHNKHAPTNEYVPLRNASRKWRVMAAFKLNDLLDALHRENEQQHKEVSDARVKAQDFLQNLVVKTTLNLPNSQEEDS